MLLLESVDYEASPAIKLSDLLAHEADLDRVSGELLVYRSGVIAHDILRLRQSGERPQDLANHRVVDDLQVVAAPAASRPEIGEDSLE